jgi:hypothetical protein
MDYLAVREHYRIAYHRWLSMNGRLMEVLGVVGDAALETAMLRARTEGQHLDLLDEYARLSIEFDRAADKWDAAQLWQSRRTVAAQRQVDRDLSLLEC